ncbi:hypothetical protein ZIOFF_023779 [Zingiber officinale]|uniref:ATP synthase subunit epsilon, mitochondrial n=1 Tax=Zingiber officinale TaxID=94328 RepID=A0A8J5H1D3_ZINOF|nr:hypothetical protein ZIOFF_023779 [Zingiber officinale]
MASTGAAVPFWRAAGMTYISYSNICASLVRSCLKEPHRSTAAAREKVHFAISKWANGKPESPSPTLSAISHVMDSVEESVCVRTPKLLVGVSLAGRASSQLSLAVRKEEKKLSYENSMFRQAKALVISTLGEFAEICQTKQVRASSRIGSGLTDEATLNEASFLVLGRHRIVRRDIKASNVLLGPDFEPQAKPLMETGKIDELVDPVFQGNYDRDQAQRLVLAASHCVRQSSFCRPSMTEVRLVPTQFTSLNQLDFLAMLIRIPRIGSVEEGPGFDSVEALPLTWKIPESQLEKDENERDDYASPAD